MATTFGFFSDAALTVPLSSGITATQKADASVVDPVVTQVWFGSLGSAGGDTTDVKVQRSSDPGVANVAFNIVAQPSSSHVVTEIKLSAALPADWDLVTPGSGISTGVEVISGIANAFSFYIWVDDATHVVALLTELSVDTDALLEIPNP